MVQWRFFNQVMSAFALSERTIKGLLQEFGSLLKTLSLSSLHTPEPPPLRPQGGWSLGQRNGGVPTWVDLAGIDPRDQTQGI